MSANTFPAQIEPQKWAEQGFSWSGSVPLSRFGRIAQDAVPSADGLHVAVDCRLFLDDFNYPTVAATLSTAVPLVCQRCLTPVLSSIQTQVHLSLLTDAAQAERLEEDADFVILSEEQLAHGGQHADLIDLIALLEDELLLSLPLSPRHEQCELAVKNVIAPDEPPVKENPFLVLAALKNNAKS